MTRDGLVTIYDGTGQNNNIKIKWQKHIRAYGKSMILSFLVSNFLSYSGNLNRGRKKSMLKFGTPTIALPLAIKKMYCSDCMHCIWLLGTFVNSSCDIKINIKIVQNCCRNLAVRGLSEWEVEN